MKDWKGKDWKSCERCDYPNGPVTYRNQVLIPINGRVHAIDYCIHHIVAALNAGGVLTTSSCCGHGSKLGTILLADGRELLIRPYDRSYAFDPTAYDIPQSNACNRSPCTEDSEP